jgi:hypothetical protein
MVYGTALVSSNLVAPEAPPVEPGGGGDSPTCGSWWQQAKLITCAALCSVSTAGAGTVLCGWACWCMLCPTNSELSKIIC